MDSLEQLPVELKTPPLGAVALVGFPGVHAALSAHLRTELRPPLHCISVASVDAAAQLFPARKPKFSSELSPQAPSSSGILRVDWLTKHRQHRPAVAVVFFPRDAVLSDATHPAVCAQLEAVRAAVRRRGASLLVVFVCDSAHAPLPEDKLAGLCRRGALDARFIVPLVVSSDGVQAAGLRRLALMLQETAAGFYRVEGARAAAKLGPRLVVSEASARAAFKAAVYAEFRQDWATALQFYRAAYTATTELPALPTDSHRWQRWHERAAVAEWCHFKIVTLLLHTGGAGDAVAQLQRHMAKCRRPPPGLPASLLPSHWGYVLRQFSVFGELLQARLPAGEPLSLPQAEQPGTYFAAAASAGIRRRHAWAMLGEALDGALPSSPPITAGVYVGQFRRETGGPPLLDEEFQVHQAAAEVPADYTKRNLELLSRAHTLLRHAKSDATGSGRVLSSILAQMANEYLCAGDSASALRLLRSVAAVYRRDGWDVLLADTLASLRECARRLSLRAEHATFSFELGSLHAGGGEPLPERTAVLSAALAAMRDQDDKEAAGSLSLTLTEACVKCIGGFSQATASAGDSLAFCVALLSLAVLPVPLHALTLEVHCGEEVSTAQLLPIAACTDGSALAPQTWSVFKAVLAAPAAGCVLAGAVLLHVSANTTMRCPLVEATLPADATPLPPADPAATGAAHVTRHGGIVGQLRVTSMVGIPGAALALSSCTRALAGELVQLDVIVTAQDDALRTLRCELEFCFAADDECPALPQPELFVLDADSQSLVQLSGALGMPDVPAHGRETCTVWVRWAEPCSQQMLHATLTCTTARGTATLEAKALAPTVLPPFVLQPSYTAAWQQHSFLPGAGLRTVLPGGEYSVLAAVVRAQGDVTIRALQLEPAPGWASRAFSDVAGPHVLRAGDACTRCFELSPSEATLDAVPGVLTVHWETTASASLKLPPAALELPLPPVAVAEPPLSVRTHVPAIFVVGAPITLCTTVQNRTSLAQELAVSVSDAPGFVFSGERTHTLEVLPHSTARVRHTLVPHAAGWQSLPELVVGATRYAARLTGLPGRESVCVRPAARGV